MAMRDQFPRTSAAYPGLIDWNQEFDWSLEDSRAQALLLIGYQNHLAEEGQEAFSGFCDTLADDVGALAPIGELSVTADTIDEFRFLFAIRPIEQTLALGLYGDCYGWVMWALARGCNRRGRVYDVLWSFFPPDSRAADDYRNLSQAYLPRWTDSFFLLARKFGGLDQMATATAAFCWRGCTDALLLGVDADECFAGLVSLANWAVNAGEPQAEFWVRILAGMWDRPIPARARARIGILMITEAHRYTERDLQGWAHELLDNWRPLLTEHLLLQVLAVSVPTREDWLVRRDEIIEATSELARFYRENAPNPMSALQALESRVGIIHPLIYSLTEYGTVDDLLDVLGAWYANGRSCDGDVLVIATTHRHGVGYIWPGGRLIIRREDAHGTFERMMEAASVAQRDFHRVAHVGDQLPQIDLDRMGEPNEAAAPEFEQAVRAHFEPQRLAEALPVGAASRSTLSIPALPVPIGALLARDTDAPVAQEVSLRQALPDRPINRVAVWPGSTMHAGFEVEALERVSAQAGWELEVSENGDDPDAFVRFYERHDADLLWVIGHGEHSPYRLEESGLAIGDRLVTADALTRIPVNARGRRLLVLNICSGAATQVRGGIARIGLSQELATPEQQVIAHLWPIGMYTGLAFGAKLALELATGDVGSAYKSTIRGLAVPGALCAELIERLGADLDIHARLANQHDQIGSFLSWGAPVLLT
jgi:hypothetical protein